MEFKTQYNYDHTKSKKETFKNPSLTVPDMAMSAREIMNRYAQGRPLNINRYLSYTGEEYLPDPRTLDPTEIDEINEKNNEFIAEQKRLLDEKIALRKEAKRKQKEAARAANGESEAGTNGGNFQPTEFPE